GWRTTIGSGPTTASAGCRRSRFCRGQPPVESLLCNCLLEGGAYEDIYVLEVATKSERKLTSDGYEDRAPKWDPSGSWIVWASFRSRVDPEVWVMDTLGGQKRKLCDGEDPAWSPDGNTIAYSGQVQGITRKRLFLIGKDGSGNRQLTGR